MPEPVLLIHVDPNSGRYSWKAGGMKGARWHSNLKTQEDCCHDSMDAVARPCVIEFVEVRT
jgi:hypothetical protein